MKKVFALRGKANMGKSQTIRTVVEMLTDKHPDAGVAHNHKTRGDVRVVLTINDWKIGIESQGDPSSGRLVNGSLDLFVNVGCDVIVCTTRTRGATVNAVNSLDGFEVQWIEQREKSQPTEQVLRDLAVAKQILDEIETIIGSPKPVTVRSLSATA